MFGVEMRLKKQGRGHLVDGRAAARAAHTARDHGTLGQGGREAFVDQLHRKPGRLTELARQVSRGPRRVSDRAVEPAGQPDHDALRLVAARCFGQPLGKRLSRLRVEGRQGLGDGRGRIAERKADAPGTGVDREHAAYGLCDGDGDGLADPEAAEADGAFDAMT